MTAREALHQLVEELPEGDLHTAARVLQGLHATSDPVLRTLLAAPPDDEPDEDDRDGGLSEARAEARAGTTISHDEVKRLLGLG